MPQQTRYAIRCTTEEQAREVMKIYKQKGRPHVPFYTKDMCIYLGPKYGWDYEETIIYLDKYTIITYDEAISLGLLGEKKEKKSDVEKILDETIMYSQKHIRNLIVETGLFTSDKFTPLDWIHLKEEIEKKLERNNKNIHNLPVLQLEPEKVEPVNKSPSELDTRDFDLCDIFNKTKTKSDLYLGIIDYLVDKGFLQDKGRKAKESPSEDNLVAKIKELDISILPGLDARQYICDRKMLLKINEIIEVVNKHLSSK